MSNTLVDGTAVSATGSPVATRIIDCDVHSAAPSPKVLQAMLPDRWRSHAEVYGPAQLRGGGWTGTFTYPPFSNHGQRGDVWPEDGSAAGSDLTMMREQLLNLYDIGIGILNPLDCVALQANQDYAIALASVVNEWQLENFVAKDRRLRLSLVIPYESAEASVREIERLGDDPGVSSILMLAGTIEPLGHRRYWPIYEAAERYDLPIVLHLIQGGGNPNTPCGWASYHLEYHAAHYQMFQGQILSLICEGTFEQFPSLRFVMAEGGVAHVAGLLQRFDYHWERLGAEVPTLTRRPSEYVRDHLWFSTQPIDESENPRDVVEHFEQLGIDNIVFASDYPHWDMDAPNQVLPNSMSKEDQLAILELNARRLFNLDPPTT